MWKFEFPNLEFMYRFWRWSKFMERRMVSKLILNLYGIFEECLYWWLGYWPYCKIWLILTIENLPFLLSPLNNLLQGSIHLSFLHIKSKSNRTYTSLSLFLFLKHVKIIFLSWSREWWCKLAKRWPLESPRAIKGKFMDDSSKLESDVHNCNHHQFSIHIFQR